MAAIIVDSPPLPPTLPPIHRRVLVCQGSKCQAKGAMAVLQAVSAVVGDSQSVEVVPCK